MAGFVALSRRHVAQGENLAGGGHADYLLARSTGISEPPAAGASRRALDETRSRFEDFARAHEGSRAKFAARNRALAGERGGATTGPLPMLGAPGSNAMAPPAVLQSGIASAAPVGDVR